jgi:hypothetical protein
MACRHTEWNELIDRDFRELIPLHVEYGQVLSLQLTFPEYLDSSCHCVVAKHITNSSPGDVVGCPVQCSALQGVILTDDILYTSAARRDSRQPAARLPAAGLSFALSKQNISVQRGYAWIPTHC